MSFLRYPANPPRSDDDLREFIRTGCARATRPRALQASSRRSATVSRVRPLLRAYSESGTCERQRRCPSSPPSSCPRLVARLLVLRATDSTALNARGANVVAVDLPSVGDDPALGTLADDAAVISSAASAVGGPVVVVAHSYGGAATSEAVFASNVEALVFLCAFARHPVAHYPSCCPRAASALCRSRDDGTMVSLDGLAILPFYADWRRSAGAGLATVASGGSCDHRGILADARVSALVRRMMRWRPRVRWAGHEGTEIAAPPLAVPVPTRTNWPRC